MREEDKKDEVGYPKDNMGNCSFKFCPYLWFLSFSPGNHKTGTVEFWWFTNDAHKGSNVCFHDGNTQIIWLGIENGRFRGYWNNAHHNAQGCAAKKWYHHRIDINQDPGRIIEGK